MEKILITGCAGFIGSNLVESLLRMDYKVMGLDCFTDYYSSEIKKKNMINFVNNKNFVFIKNDLNVADLKNIIEDVDYIFHLAAQPGVRASWGQNFEIYIKNNILATQKILEACKDSDIKKFIFSSSSSVYGNANKLPINEDAMKTPISPYGVTKLAAENLCNLYYENYNIPTVSLRYFTVYGPRQRPDMAFHKFIYTILNNGPITVYGNGKQTRDFTYILDVIDATILAMRNGVNGEVYNIGGGSRISVSDVIKIIEQITKKKARIEYKQFQKGDVKDTYADINKAKNRLKYQPNVNIKTGLKLQIDSIK